MIVIKELSKSQFCGAFEPSYSILSKVESANFKHLNNWVFCSEAKLPIPTQIHLLLNEHMNI